MGEMKSENFKSRVADTFHLVSAIIFIAMLSLGLYMTGLKLMHPWYHKAPDLHKSLGIAVFFLILIRLFWRLSFIKPVPILWSSWKQILDQLLHRVFYLLFFGIILCGYLISTADGRGVEFFGLFEVPPLISYKETQEEVAGKIHLTLALLDTLSSGHSCEYKYKKVQA